MAAVAEMNINDETVLLAQRMNELYLEYRQKKIKREDADSLANIAGKHLKAVQINFANQVFTGQLERDLEKLTRPDRPALTEPRFVKGKAASASP